MRKFNDNFHLRASILTFRVRRQICLIAFTSEFYSRLNNILPHSVVVCIFFWWEHKKIFFLT